MHWSTMAATDFFTVEVWTCFGLARYHVLFVIRLMTRTVHIAGIAPEPAETWMLQVARNLTGACDGFLRGSRFLIHDRSTLFTEQFRAIMRSIGVEPLRLPARSPNLNAFAERFVRSIKESCLDRLVLIGESSSHRAVSEFVLHYHKERNHQGLDNKIIIPDVSAFPATGTVRCRSRLGGMLRYYHREAA
jgi:transposase InsO family protein